MDRPRPCFRVSPVHSLKMHLAQELVDLIIDFLHDDPKTLTQMSLVSVTWVSRTRTHLCKIMEIPRRKFISSNLSYLTPLCKYVKTLRFTWPTGDTDPSAILDCFEHSELHTLSIISCELHSLDEQTIRQCFAKFPCPSITTLELHDISSGNRAFLTLLSLFPNVDNLTIPVDHWWKDSPGHGPLIIPDSGNEVVQPISPRFRGSFNLFDPSDHGFWGFQ